MYWNLNTKGDKFMVRLYTKWNSIDLWLDTLIKCPDGR